MSDEPTQETLAGISAPERENQPKAKSLGRPFKKGTSGNPGGRSKLEAQFRDKMMELSPEVAKAFRQYIQGPTPEELEGRANPMWFQAMAKERITAIKVWCEFTVPKPKTGDVFDVPMPTAVDPSRMNSLAMLSDARHIIAMELARLRTLSDMNLPLSESAAVRLTECVRQLSVLTESEEKLLKADPFASLSDEELKAKANAN